MRWEIKDKSPKKGDVRFVTKFAWLPTVVLNKLTMTDHRIWLELYVEEQVYRFHDIYLEYVPGGYWHTVAKTIHV
jgi:hypothetical protein